MSCTKNPMSRSNKNRNDEVVNGTFFCRPVGEWENEGIRLRVGHGYAMPDLSGRICGLQRSEVI